MAETSSASPLQQTPKGQPNKEKKSPFQVFLTAFKARKASEDEHHALYQKYGRWAESVKITIQMCIGIILGIALLLQVIAYIIGLFSVNPFSNFFISYNPLDIIAFGLFFSTGVDLAYMLFTPGPDEAIDPVMTGLAAAILLGIGRVDYKKLQLQHGIILFLAVAALAGLFATKKHLYIHSHKQNNNGTKNQTQLTQQESEIPE